MCLICFKCKMEISLIAAQCDYCGNKFLLRNKSFSFSKNKSNFSIKFPEFQRNQDAVLSIVSNPQKHSRIERRFDSNIPDRFMALIWIWWLMPLLLYSSVTAYDAFMAVFF